MARPLKYDDELPTGSLEHYIRKAADEAVARTLACLGDVAPLAKEWLTPRELSSYVGAHEVTLSKMRSEGRGPPFHRFGKSIRYSRREVDAYMAALPQEAAEGDEEDAAS